MQQGVFYATNCDLLFPPHSLGLPLAKSPKMADLGVLAKSLMTGLC